ncbi:MAG: primosomal replication protein N [Burkholderiales bacterium]|nr:primosomal replication protein N [Burkholderiales bacterium]
MVELTGAAIAIDAVRYTPAGIPIVELVLSHESTQTEAGRSRKVALDVPALAAGEQALRLATCPLGAALKVSGFLARRGKSQTRLVVHINAFEYI